MIAQPNILLITTDTQRCDTIAHLGNPNAVSPHLDRLAREGVTFTNAHTSSPVCMPARCSLLTGTHTPIHGCIENGIARHDHLTVLPDLLKAAGYTNIMVGKTHFGPIAASFDVQCVVGEKNSPMEDPYTTHLHRHGYSRPTTYPHTVPESLFMDAFLVDTTIQEIDRAVAQGQRPFFAFCSLVSPHEPLDPPGAWGELYRDRPLPPLNYRAGEVAGYPAHLHQVLGIGRRTDQESPFSDEQPDMAVIDERRRRYYGLAAYCDEQIGRLLRHLKATGLRERTLVIFSSDHGTELFDHGFYDKHNYYDASWRVPLIISMPGTLPAGEQRDFAIWNDIAPTILAAAGTGCATMQGFDLSTPLMGGDSSPRRCAVATLYTSCALATRRWKLEYYLEEGHGRLFDRQRDAAEQDDLYESAAHREVRAALVEALLAWRSNLVDVQWLQEHTAGGGPIAKIVARHTHAMRGTDAEERLNTCAVRVDDTTENGP